MTVEDSADDSRSIPDTLPVLSDIDDDLASLTSSSSSFTSPGNSTMQLPLPIPYTVSPALFPSNILQKMRTQSLNQNERGKVLDCVYDDITGRYQT